MFGSKEVATIIHNMDYEDFHLSGGSLSSSGNPNELRPLELDLNSFISWKQEVIDHENARKDIPNQSHRKYLRKVNTKAKHHRQVIITLSTKPSRVKFIANIISQIDIERYPYIPYSLSSYLILHIIISHTLHHHIPYSV